MPRVSHAMSEEVVELQILDFVRERTRVAGIDPRLDLVDHGILDSLLLAELVLFVEERFGVSPTLDELDMANFASVAQVTSLVMGHLAGPPASAGSAA